MQEKTWQAQVQSMVSSMVQPLVADGGSFRIESCDFGTREIVIRASMANCDSCAMSEEDLARLLEEAVQRNDPQAKVSVISGA